MNLKLAIAFHFANSFAGFELLPKQKEAISNSQNNFIQ
jgi:hypothetical protein